MTNLTTAPARLARSNDRHPVERPDQPPAGLFAAGLARSYQCTRARGTQAG
jgi:hypothetical protein